MNDKKVYLVTQGDYSDYRVVAVFADEEQADEFAIHISTSYEAASVEEYLMIDDINGPLPHEFTVHGRMNMSDLSMSSNVGRTMETYIEDIEGCRHVHLSRSGHILLLTLRTKAYVTDDGVTADRIQSRLKRTAEEMLMAAYYEMLNGATIREAESMIAQKFDAMDLEHEKETH